MIHFSERLRSLIAQKNISRKEICNATRLSQSTLSNYLNDKPPAGMEVLAALADKLEVSIDFLVLGKEPAPQGSNVPAIENALIQHSIQMEQRVERHSDLMIRVLSAFRNQVSVQVADAVRDNESFSAILLSEENVCTLELCANTVTCVSPRMIDELRYAGPQAERGEYYSYIVKNYHQNRNVAYRFFVNRNSELPDDFYKHFMKLLAEDHVRPRKRTRNRIEGTFQINVVDEQIFTHIVIYDLRLKEVKKQDPILYEHIQRHLGEQGILGIALFPTTESQLNVMINEEYLNYTNMYIKHLQSKVVKCYP